ncbi:plasmid stabilization protein [Methylobacterium sp. Leaf99]|uniref:type II toxin-antitoxin system RelE/ParE family toxin n=1 Tax=Methylobacterium sp. Leaf99 TaxID=1736251 RepID=UPI0006F747F7|nr:type II toxin-antitoxin system RelE/ParE family toxin [Methylobacterium sp. Leaf99]KQP10689.1 plasmid stabilization protein [Methylobacterium sp. Leaf99]
MARYRLTRRAESDLLDVFLFGLERFGETQSERYRVELERCFRLLAETLGLGRSARIIAPDVRRHEHERHIILCEEDADGILVLALVHARSVRRLKL